MLAARAAGPALLLATARPEFLESHVGLAGGDLTVVALRPLSDTQSDRLVSELLGDSESLQSLVADIRQKADGNPFFLEEILQRLIDEGAIVHEAGRWRPTQRATEIRLPDTIHGLLAARILGAGDPAVLERNVEVDPREDILARDVGVPNGAGPVHGYRRRCDRSTSRQL